MEVIELTQFEYVRVSGPDAISFLQGQVTCDMEQLSADRCLVGALCNLKGRVIADFLAVLIDGDCILQVSKGNALKVQTTLAKYAVFSKVEVSVDAGPNAVLGVLDAGQEQIGGVDLPAWSRQAYAVKTAAAVVSLCLPGQSFRHQLWCWDESLAQELVAQAAGNEAAWHRSEILAGVVHVKPEMSEQYTPQLLNYDQSGVVDFKKGCYTGQEVVARMYYRAQAKKRLYLLQADGQAFSLPAASELILNTGDASVSAEILAHVNSSNPDQPPVLLAILPTGSETETARLAVAENPEISLHVLNLPYTE